MPHALTHMLMSTYSPTAVTDSSALGCSRSHRRRPVAKRGHAARTLVGTHRGQPEGLEHIAVGHAECLGRLHVADLHAVELEADIVACEVLALAVGRGEPAEGRRRVQPKVHLRGKRGRADERGGEAAGVGIGERRREARTSGCVPNVV